MDAHPIPGHFTLTAEPDRSLRLKQLFESHHDRLYRLARRLVPSTDDALDLVQETFLRAARSLSSVPSGHTGEEAWLVRTLVNLRRDQWRKLAVRTQHTKTEVGFHDSPECSAITKDLVWGALDLLAPRRRTIVVMHELEGLSVPEISKLLGLAAVTVRWHLSVGKKELARALKPQLWSRQ